jgi:alpha-amylase/alpha-mannosidase (GH57 family)
MHQPSYVWPGTAAPILPWVRLHAAKAYSDMAAALENHPGARCSVNFSGVLIEQLERLNATGVRDAHWELSTRDPAQMNDSEREQLVRHFFSLHWDRLVHPHPRYAELLELREHGYRAFETQDLLDLQVLFNLQWCGWWLRSTWPGLRSVIDRGRDFTVDDRSIVLAAQDHALRTLRSRWRALAARGQVELTFTPMYHPILPLLIDSDHARRCLPDHPMPPRFAFPEWAVRQVQQGHEVVQDWGATSIIGAWPAEGSVSPEAAAIFAEHGLRWIASDEDVLRRSRHSGAFVRSGWWRLPTARGEIGILFRDHAASDAIGFSYATIPAAAAVADFIDRMTHPRPDDGQGTRVVILDGENPWEAYPDDGREFMDQFFAALESSGKIRGVRCSDVLDEEASGVVEHLHTGSWISADFHIWIGAGAKNRGWALLQQTTEAAGDEHSHQLRDTEVQRRIAAHLMAAQGSDWFWWYGDNFHSQNDAEFDSLFRALCGAVWDDLGRQQPVAVGNPIDEGGYEHEHEAPTREIQPVVDGQVSHYFEWTGAGVLRQPSGQGAMHRGTRVATVLLYGFHGRTLYLRADPQSEEAPFQRVTVELFRPGSDEVLRSISATTGLEHAPGGVLAVGRIMEARLDLDDFDGLDSVDVVVQVESARGDRERLPSLGRWTVSMGELAREWWLV